MIIKGKIWKLKDNIDTDVIIPARYLNTSDPQELALHCLEDYDPEFMNKMQQGDIIVAGNNFGCGSSREHAPITFLPSLIISGPIPSPGIKAKLYILFSPFQYIY